MEGGSKWLLTEKRREIYFWHVAYLKQHIKQCNYSLNCMTDKPFFFNYNIYVNNKLTSAPTCTYVIYHLDKIRNMTEFIWFRPPLISIPNYTTYVAACHVKRARTSGWNYVQILVSKLETETLIHLWFILAFRSRL
jgi:hypothetical protein